MNGGSGGGGGGFILLLFLLIYATTFFLLGRKLWGNWGGVVAACLGIGMPLILDAQSSWFPLGAFVYMFIAWLIALPTLIFVAIAMRIGKGPQKIDAPDFASAASTKGDINSSN